MELNAKHSAPEQTTIQYVKRTCGGCDGTGRIYEGTTVEGDCFKCNGFGWVYNTKPRVV